MPLTLERQKTDLEPDRYERELKERLEAMGYSDHKSKKGASMIADRDARGVDLSERQQNWLVKEGICEKHEPQEGQERDRGESKKQQIAEKTKAFSQEYQDAGVDAQVADKAGNAKARKEVLGWDKLYGKPGATVEKADRMAGFNTGKQPTEFDKVAKNFESTFRAAGVEEGLASKASDIMARRDVMGIKPSEAQKKVLYANSQQMGKGAYSKKPKSIQRGALDGLNQMARSKQKNQQAEQ